MVKNVFGRAQLDARLFCSPPDGPISRVNQVNELFALLNKKMTYFIWNVIVGLLGFAAAVGGTHG